MFYVNMLINSPNVTFYLLSSAMFTISVTVCEIFSQNMHDFAIDLWNGTRSNVNMPMERLYATSYLWAIVMFALSSFASEMYTNFTFNIGQDQT